MQRQAVTRALRALQQHQPSCSQQSRRLFSQGRPVRGSSYNNTAPPRPPPTQETPIWFWFASLGAASVAAWLGHTYSVKQAWERAYHKGQESVLEEIQAHKKSEELLVDAPALAEEKVKMDAPEEETQRADKEEQEASSSSSSSDNASNTDEKASGEGEGNESSTHAAAAAAGGSHDLSGSVAASDTEDMKLLKAVSVSAPGKVILHGEHAVVHGKTAIAASLNLRTECKLTPTTRECLRLRLKDLGAEFRFPLADLAALRSKSGGEEQSEDRKAQMKQFCAQHQVHNGQTNELLSAQALVAAEAFLHLYSEIVGVENNSACDLDITSTLPIGAGLGSSAAFSVCVAASLLSASGRIAHGTVGSEWPENEVKVINEWAFAAEKVIHGNPSGIDNSISSRGGALSFQKGMTAAIVVPKLNILLVNTTVPRSTRTLVAGVKDRKNAFPKVMNGVLQSMEDISFDAIDVLADLSRAQTQGNMAQRKEIYAKLQTLVDINQGLLNAIGVGHPQLDKVCYIALEHGMHAKLTGAGGGGCAWILIPDSATEENVEAVRKSLAKANFEVYRTSMGGPGVTRDA